MLTAVSTISISKSGDDDDDERGTGRFTPDQIAQAIARHEIQPTSQFTAEQIALKILVAQSQKRPQLRVKPVSSRRNQRGYTYGDCHWAGK